MRTIRYTLTVIVMIALLFIGSGFAYGPQKDVLLRSAETTPIVAEPMTALSIGIVLIVVGLFGRRKFIKRSF